MIAQNTLRISFSLNVLLVVFLYVLCPRMHLIVQHIQIAREEWKYVLRKMSPSIAFCVVVTLINISSKDPVWSKSWFSQSPPACKGTSLSAFSKCPEGLSPTASRLFIAFSLSPSSFCHVSQCVYNLPYSASPKINLAHLFPTLICCVSRPCILICKLLLWFSSSFWYLEADFCSLLQKELVRLAFVLFCLKLLSWLCYSEQQLGNRSSQLFLFSTIFINIALTSKL